jgi:hypothetical protein
MAAPEEAVPEPVVLSEYWLSNCNGFTVDCADGRLGSVEAVRLDSRWAEGRVLAVRAGLFGKRLLIIPLGEIRSILPRERRVVLESSPTLLGTE